EREGLTIDEDRLHDAVAEFKISRGLELDTDLVRFLADNELSPEDFERLVVTDEMVRWACEQAQLETFGSLLDDLRLNGDYPQLVTRAKAKLEDQERPGAPADSVRTGQAAIQWYFAQRRGTAVPDDLAGYARSCGFPDEQAFRAAVRREHWYVRPDCGPAHD
ncbi:MAG TPA: hypothetical protein VHS32_37615, partial [Streptosporangiaceae bacterium]|nr:hypothetical protein [Streptosporangiaceae bacterium]